MPLLKLTIADLPVDDRTATTRTGWINTDHIESAAAHITWHELGPTLWLELTMSSGTVHHILIGPVPATDIDAAADIAITHLLHRGAHAGARNAAEACRHR